MSMVVGPVVALVVMSLIGWWFESAPRRRYRRVLRRMTQQLREVQRQMGEQLVPSLRRCTEAMNELVEVYARGAR